MSDVELSMKVKELPAKLRNRLDADDDTICQVRITVVDPDLLNRRKTLLAKLQEQRMVTDIDPVELIRAQRAAADQ